MKAFSEKNFIEKVVDWLSSPLVQLITGTVILVLFVFLVNTFVYIAIPAFILFIALEIIFSSSKATYVGQYLLRNGEQEVAYAIIKYKYGKFLQPVKVNYFILKGLNAPNWKIGDKVSNEFIEKNLYFTDCISKKQYKALIENDIQVLDELKEVAGTVDEINSIGIKNFVDANLISIVLEEGHSVVCKTVSGEYYIFCGNIDQNRVPIAVQVNEDILNQIQNEYASSISKYITGKKDIAKFNFVFFNATMYTTLSTFAEKSNAVNEIEEDNQLTTEESMTDSVDMSIDEVVSALCTKHTENVKREFKYHLTCIYEDNLQHNISKLVEQVKVSDSKLIYFTDEFVMYYSTKKNVLPIIIPFKSVIMLNTECSCDDNEHICDIVTVYSKYDTSIFWRTFKNNGFNIVKLITQIALPGVMIGNTAENRLNYTRIVEPYSYNRIKYFTEGKMSKKKKGLYLFLCIFPYTAMFGIEHFYVGNIVGGIMGMACMVSLFLSVILGPVGMILFSVYGLFMWFWGIRQAYLTSKIRVKDSKGNYLVNKKFRV